MTKDDFTHTSGLPASDNARDSLAPIELPSHLRGADLARYVLEQAERRRILRELEQQEAERDQREAERAKREQANAELEPFRPKREPISAPEAEAETSANPSAPSVEPDPSLLNEWEI